MKQRDIFLNGEGDNWYLRNASSVMSARNLDVEFLVRNLKNLGNANRRFLEIGSSNGVKTKQLAQSLSWTGYGLDPSEIAIREASVSASGCEFLVGTADKLPFEDQYFDLCFFGFCLYLIDRDDLEKVFQETVRVLKPNGLIAILDFDAGFEKKNSYIHHQGVFSYKEDYCKYLYPAGFNLIAKESYADGSIGLASNPDERYSITLLCN